MHIIYNQQLTKLKHIVIVTNNIVNVRSLICSVREDSITCSEIFLSARCNVVNLGQSMPFLFRLLISTNKTLQVLKASSNLGSALGFVIGICSLSLFSYLSRTLFLNTFPPYGIPKKLTFRNFPSVKKLRKFHSSFHHIQMWPFLHYII